MNNSSNPLDQCAIDLGLDGYGHAREVFEQVARNLTAMADAVYAEQELHAVAKRLQERAAQLTSGRFSIIIIGDFSRGKSTLLNAMLGEVVLFQKAAECTPVVTVLRYAEEKSASVYFTDGQSPERLDLKEFRDKYQLQIDDAHNREDEIDRFSNVDKAVIEYPCELLRHQVELVDSPGLGAHKARAQRTQQFIEHADAIVFVLHAQQFLNKDELHMVDNVLIPSGLSNIFFVINFFNLLKEGALFPDDLERDIAELDKAIQLRLSPLCIVNGEDRTSDRVFRVNALGALKARFSQPPKESMLEESAIPALEKALEQFLVKDRVRAINDVTRSVVQDAIRRFDEMIRFRQALANKNIVELEREYEAIQPKLDRLRGIRKHVDGFLRTTASNLADRLAMSLQITIGDISKRLDEEVSKFDYGKLKSNFMVWRRLTDSVLTKLNFKKEEDHFANQIKQQLEPQIQKLLERELNKWQNSALHNAVKTAQIDVEKHLQEEAEEYHRVLKEIEEKLGIWGKTVEARVLVDTWLGKVSGEITNDVALAGLSFVGLTSWLLGSFAADFVVDLFVGGATASTVGAGAAAGSGVLAFAPWLLVMVAGLRIGFKEFELHRDFGKNIAKSLRERMIEREPTHISQIRQRVQKDFDALREKVTGAISEQIDAIDQVCLEVIDRKKAAEANVEQEKERLKKKRAEFDTLSQEIIRVLQAV